MTTLDNCPETARLKQWLDEALTEQEQAELSAHLELCEKCQQAIEGLAAGRETWEGAARELGASSGVNAAALQNVIDDLRDRAPDATVHADDHMELPAGFLEPPDDPRHLGKVAHYDVIEIIGRGAMGVVLRAFDRKLQRVVAMKVMAPQFATNATARRRFARESQAAAAVCHEHVVTIHAVEQEGVLPYLVMQFISGRSLQERVDQSGPLQVKEILRIGMQAAEGLAAAHKQGLVHRDIKPANILLENGVERVKITDFGLARAVDDASLTQSGVIAGTPQYMAPEQARGEPVDHRSDLFSLGCVLYTMCTGRAPFRGSTMMAVMKRVCEDTARPIRDLNPDIPEWLAHIVARSMAKNPAERFQSAAELADLLEKCLAHMQHPRSVPLPSEITHLSQLRETPATSLTTEESAAARTMRETPAPAEAATAEDGFTPGPWMVIVVGVILLIAAKWMAPGAASKSVNAVAALAIIGGFLDLFGIGLVSILRRIAGREESRPGKPAGITRPISPEKLESARRMVKGPAIGLAVAAVVNWLGLIASAFIWLYLAAAQSPPDWIDVAPIVAAILFLGSGLMIWGALKMSRLESYGWAIAATAGAMFIGPGYLVGWPVGLWSLFVLTRPEVAEAFDSQRAGAHLLSRRTLIPGVLLLLIGMLTVNYLVDKAHTGPVIPFQNINQAYTVKNPNYRPGAKAVSEQARIPAENSTPPRVQSAAATSETVTKKPPVSDASLENLQRLVALAAEELERVRKLLEKQVVSTMEATDAEINLKNAEIRLAEAQRDRAAAVSLLKQLVTLREKNFETIKRLHEKQVATASEVAQYEKTLIEDRVRLEAAEKLAPEP